MISEVIWDSFKLRAFSNMRMGFKYDFVDEGE